MSAAVAIRVHTPAGKSTNVRGLNFHVELPTGLRGVAGTPEDGLLALAPLIAGVERARAGAVQVFDGDPAREPGLRSRIGASFHDPVLLDAPTVGALVHDIDRLRGGDAARQAFARFSLTSWLSRRLGSLDRRELRTIELVAALSTPQPLVIVLTEPTVDVAVLDRELVRRALSEAAEGGACVVVASASVTDAASLAPVIHVLVRGKLSEATPVDRLGTLAWRGYPSLRIDVDLPRLLVTALTDDPAVSGVAWDQGAERSIVTLHGQDLDQLALALASAAGKSGVAVRSIVPVLPDLDQMKARASGLALAAYHAGYRAYWAQHQPPTTLVEPNRGPG